jgi:phage gp46-like protein
MDIGLFYDNEISLMDIAVNKNDLVADEGLETSALISLYSDRRAAEDIRIDDPEARQGWWGDLVQGFELGSLLWLQARAKLTQNEINLTRMYIEECLEWMKEDGVAKDVIVELEQIGSVETPILVANIRIFKSDGTIEEQKFDDLWENQIQKG